MDHRLLAQYTSAWHVGLDESDMTANAVQYDDETYEQYIISIPFKYSVCTTCNGTGHHVNPAIDSHGITDDERSQWPHDESDRYFGGVYDIPCYGCQGSRLVAVLDEQRATKAQKQIYFDICQSKYKDALEKEREVKYGY
jgi:hypothetical protein